MSDEYRPLGPVDREDRIAQRVADEAHQREIWLARCPALFAENMALEAECDRLRKLVCQIVESQYEQEPTLTRYAGAGQEEPI